MTDLLFDGTFRGWKATARDALTRGIPPGNARWIERRGAQAELELAVNESGSSEPASDSFAHSTSFRVPRAFMVIATEVSCYRDDTRWSLLYRALWRLTHGEMNLLEIAFDPDVSALNTMAKAVRREVHKMHAFVRFREIPTETGAWFVAWFEPQHLIVEAAASFFADRFAAMRWSILTPDCCAHWDGKILTFTEGVDRRLAPAEDVTEDLWRTYYASIFNPARVKIGAMTKEMPRRYWKNLPEAEIIPRLLAESTPRTAAMVTASDTRAERPSDFAPEPVPTTTDLSMLRKAATTCRACPLWRNATCTVFGEGPAHPRIVVVGEQPGDQEDRTGMPFVGPAGQLFNRALAAAGIAAVSFRPNGTPPPSLPCIPPLSCVYRTDQILKPNSRISFRISQNWHVKEARRSASQRQGAVAPRGLRLVSAKTQHSTGNGVADLESITRSSFSHDGSALPLLNARMGVEW